MPKNEAIKLPTHTPSPLIARLATLCDSSGLTRAEIAQRAGMLPPHLSRMLAGVHDPSAASLKRVLDAIECQWADLDESQQIR